MFYRGKLCISNMGFHLLLKIDHRLKYGTVWDTLVY
jgi:hypothetical protein